ncbi:MAG: DUF4114 domain-containing protein [Leptolyngbyaceae cyanobacterium]
MKIFTKAQLAIATAAFASTLAAAEAQAFTFQKTATSFTDSYSQELLDFFKSNVNGEREALSDAQLQELDASTLIFDTSKSVEVYFIDEGAGYKNQVLFSAADSEKQMLFGNASKQGSGGSLNAGDGFELSDFGGLPAVAQFELFIKANGYNGGTNVYGANPDENPDGINHITAFGYNDEASGEYFTFIGFEDLYNGGDRDFNDVVLVAKGLTSSADVPEPMSALAVLAVGAVAAGSAVKKKLA